MNPLVGPQIRSAIEAETPVPLERVITARGIESKINSLVGEWPFAVIAMDKPDREYFRLKMRGGGIKGRDVVDGMPEAVISDPVARSLKKGLGDNLLQPSWDGRFSPKPVKIVGIVPSDVFFAYVSLDYHRAYHSPPIDLNLCFTKDPARQKEFDAWALQRFTTIDAKVFSYTYILAQSDQMFEILYRILNIVICVLVVVITFMMALLMNIHQTQRLQEYALLQALGYTKQQLVTRSLLEMSILIVGGWVAGCFMAYGLLSVVNAVLMYPRAFALDLLDRQAYLSTLPVPIAILATASYTILRNFRKFDPIGILERRTA
ncbi:MAG: ABC transporter permease [Chthonomonas sp.]|nr:ABC transporter permease [Chthonomonas sp.]